MRVLFTCHGAYGHFHPVAPLALAVQARGHDVVVATSPAFVEWVRKCGLRAEPIGLTAAEFNERVDALGITDRRMAAFHLFSTVAVPPMATDLIELGQRWSPDVVVHEEGEYAGPLTAARLGIPCITHSWTAPARPGSERAHQALAGVGDPIQAYCDLLEVRWLLSEQAKQDVGEDAALEALARRSVPAGSAAKMAIADISTGQLPALTPAMLNEMDATE